MYAQVEASASTDTLDELDLKDDETIGNVIVSSSRRALHTRRLLAAVALLLSMLAGFTAGFFVRNSVANASVTADINDVSNSLVPAANQQSATQYVNSKHILHCGGSISEALANNCVFDSILQQWVPGPCFDREHHENFLKAHPRKWFSDSELQHEMSDSIVRQGDYRVAFTPSDYHKRHCTYTWEIMVRALRSGRPVLSEGISFKHTRHCNKVMLGPDWNATANRPTKSVTGFMACAAQGTWFDSMPE